MIWQCPTCRHTPDKQHDLSLFPVSPTHLQLRSPTPLILLHQTCLQLPLHLLSIYAFLDDTYMYDEDARVLGPGGHDRGHWYDEPPYESDPEDFLMGSNSPIPTATIQNGRVCFTMNNLRHEQRGEGVISLRSAGDISLPRDPPSAGTPRGTPRRGLILPQAGYPPTIIPLRYPPPNLPEKNLLTATFQIIKRQRKRRLRWLRRPKRQLSPLNTLRRN